MMNTSQPSRKEALDAAKRLKLYRKAFEQDDAPRHDDDDPRPEEQKKLASVR